MKTVNQADLKIENRRRIFQAILTGGPVSRSRLGALTGLSKMSVTNLVSELIADGVVRETEKVKTPTGRNPVNLELVPDGRHIIGLYISRDYISACLSDLSGHPAATCKFSLAAETNDSLLAKACEAVETLRAQSSPEQLAGIGVACIGPLDRKTGVILNPPNFFEVHNLPLATLLSRRFGLPVCLDNDSNACAMAERYFGKARHHRNFIYLGVGNGIGAGILTDGRLCGGANGLAGEIGHITVDQNGPVCSCGNTGCLELYASLRQDPDTLSPTEKEAEIRRVCPPLAAGCITLINLFDPEVIYLGYRFARLGESALDRLRNEIGNRYLGSQFAGVTLALSTFGDDEPLYGAVSLCVDKLTF